MKYLKYCLWIIVPAVVALTVTACREEPAEEPLLLLENGDGLGNLPPPKGPVADNSRCHVCHINYQAERLAVMHARANVGCERCHGSSDAHCGDEDNITPPDVMYPRAGINASCMLCHPKDKINTAKLPNHKPLFAAGGGPKKCCTDCHGSHRLAYRTRKWDKTTGKLLTDDGVRMLTDKPTKQTPASP
ncbi:MAG: multiheme c-type cytochrome [Phycisphaerae bacterium]